MPSCFSSLLLAMSLGVFPTPAAAQSDAPVPPPSKAQVPSPPATVQAKAPTRRRTAGMPPASPSPAGKVRSGKNAKGTPPAAKAGKAGKADCDTPVATAELARPVPVPADPLAPTLKPCAEPARTP